MSKPHAHQSDQAAVGPSSGSSVSGVGVLAPGSGSSAPTVQPALTPLSQARPGERPSQAASGSGSTLKAKTQVPVVHKRPRVLMSAQPSIDERSPGPSQKPSHKQSTASVSNPKGHSKKSSATTSTKVVDNSPMIAHWSYDFTGPEQSRGKDGKEYLLAVSFPALSRGLSTT